MKPTILVYLLEIIILIIPLRCDDNCNILESELVKIDNVLRHIEKPIYSEDQYTSDSEECTILLNGIHAQLRRLTQRYKLMNKGYVKVEEYKKMAEDYENQLKVLNDELKELQEHTYKTASNAITKLKEDIKKLDEEVGTLHKKLKGITEDFEKVKRDLCLTYLNSNQMSKAKAKLKEMASTYLIEIVQLQLNASEVNIMSVLDFSSAIPDLDDRGEAYKEIYKFLETNQRLGGEDSILLEATIMKMNATLKEGSKITDERRVEIENLLKKLSGNTANVFNKWTEELKKTDSSVVIKNALDHLFVTQMKVFGAKVGDSMNFGSIRHFMKLLVVCNNYYKVAAYKELIDRKILHALGTIMFDLLTLEVNEMKYDPHVPDEIPKLFEAALSSLPKSLSQVSQCLQKVQIFNQKSNKCIVATGNNFEVQQEKLADFHRVIVADYGCTTFRIEPSTDKASVKIVSPSGNPLVNINLHLPNNVWRSHVGTPQASKPNSEVMSSDAWILEANYENSAFKIESEFSHYKTKKTELDHLLVMDINFLPHLVVGRYGAPGLRRSEGSDTIEWMLKCAL